MPRETGFRHRKGPRPAQWTKRLAWVGLAGILVFIVGILVWLHSILLPFMLALLIAFIFNPLVNRMARFSVPRWLGVLLVYGVVLGVVALFLRFLVPIIDRESKDFVATFSGLIRQAPQMYERLEENVEGLLSNLEQASGETPVPEEEDLGASGAEWGFGPPVDKAPVSPLPEVPYLPQVTLGTSEKSFAEAGLGDVDGVPHRVLTHGLEKPEGTPESTLTIRPGPDGTYSVQLGEAPIEIKKLGEGRYLFSPKVSELEASRWGDIKTQVINSMRQGLQQVSSSLLEAFFRFFQGLVSGLMGAFIALLVIFLVGAFAMLDAPAIHRAVRQRVPQRFQIHFDDLLHRLNLGLNGVVRGQLIICLVNGVLSTVGFLIFIPQYAVILGILAGILSIIPIFGTIISSVPALLVALSIGLGNALGVLAWILGIHLIETYVLDPKIIGSQAKMHPIVVVFVLIAGERMYGMKGLLLAVPVASVIQSLIQFAYSRVRSHVS